MSQEINLLAEEMGIEPAQDKASSSERVVLDHAKKIIEALLFASKEPLPVTQIREILMTLHAFKPKEVIDLLHELQDDYTTQKRPLQLEEIAEGFILRTTEEYSEYVRQLFRDKKGERLSQAAREVLAIIAFKQPVTKPQIEAIRGVDSAATVQMLVEKELVETAGQAEAPGRPMLYVVSNRFLRHFGLKEVEELASKPEPEGPSLQNQDLEKLELN